MERRRLGKSDLTVPILSFGAMVFGDQNTEDEGHRLLDASLDRGIDFIDIAELYPTPPKRETQGASERVVGTWLTKRKRRDDVIIASKIVGPSPMMWFRQPDANPDLTYKEVIEACERSLKRLNTEYLDLYQLHWPSRSVSVWGSNPIVFKHGDRDGVPILETLRALDDLVKAGKVRHIGVSNESAWGVLRFLRLSEDHKLARIQSVQNGILAGQPHLRDCARRDQHDRRHLAAGLFAAGAGHSHRQVSRWRAAGRRAAHIIQSHAAL